ncbi:hypothetical protein MARPO_0108s0035, partial [Marchantia polymorpha]
MDKYEWATLVGRKEDGHPLISCFICTESQAANNFASKTGAVCKDVSYVSDHASSIKHKAAASKVKQRQEFKKSRAIAVSHSQAAANKFLHTAFSLTLLVVLENLPISKWAVLLGYLAWLGHPCINRKYNQKRYFWSFLSVISESLLASQFAMVASSSFYSVLLDNSKDIGNEDHCLIFLRYWDGDIWMPRSEFLCAVSLGDKSAEGMCQMLCAVLNVFDISISKMAAICTDGDSTLIGRYNGLGAKLQKTVGYLLSVHCASHKTAIALGDTAKEMEDLQELDVVLKAVHNLFSKSGSRQMQWTRFARRRGVSKLQFPLFNATRWFSRAQCVAALQENLATLILFLKRKSGKKGWKKVADLLKSVTDVTFICLLHSVADVLKPLEEFRKYFEQDNNLPHKIPGRLE